MKKYVELDSLWKCETCFHHSDGKCSPNIWCDCGESYRPAYSKFTVYTFDDNDAKIKTRGYADSEDYEVLLYKVDNQK